jgi:AraC-like DNA-binding protein
MPELTVATLAVPRLITLDLSIPLHVLGRHSGYQVIVCGEFMATHPLSAAATADIVAFRREVGTTPSTYRKSTGHADGTGRDGGTSQMDEA